MSKKENKAKRAGKSGLLTEFKAFICRGNVMDMAVGVVVGSAFTAIVNSLVKDIITPVIGLLIGDNDLSGYMIKLATNPETGEVTNSINYGLFIQNIINFLIIAFVIFLVVKLFNKLQEANKKVFAKEEEPAEEPAPAPEAPAEEPAPANDAVLTILAEIRDALKEKQA